uniref:Phosphatidic acid phosphatase type 2/haloperoxidase domain-containing protein n=1 Tax=Acrobeloides nanus TaxID=290746 RepID=A0A914CGZ6_9BILA
MMIDIVVCLISIISSFYVFVAHVIKPTERGFYCDDESIRRPYYPNTVSTTNLLIITLGLPLPIFFFGYFFASRNKTMMQILEMIRMTTFVYLDYVVGFGLCTFALDFLKCYIGRLRPNFVSMCKPDLSECSLNGTAYMINFECQNGPRMGRNSRTSFPSGHAMAAVFCFIFLYHFFQYLHRNSTITTLAKRYRFIIITLYFIFTLFCTRTSKINFLSWVHVGTSSNGDLKNEPTLKQDLALHSIRKALRKKVPLDACFNSELINWPTTGIDSDCDPKTTVHIDGFLYDDEDVNHLVDKGKLSRHYCKNCGSRDIQLLTFISHSLSVSQLRYIFNFLLPFVHGSDDFRDNILVDIGSRLGSVLYAAAEFRNFKEVVGIEMNSEFCQIQLKVVEEHHFSTPIKIICDDMRNQLEILSKANFVIMNNVFGFFQNVETQVDCWRKLRNSFNIGTILIHNPSLDSVTAHLDLGFDLNEWLEPIDLKPSFDLYVGNDENLYGDLYEE